MAKLTAKQLKLQQMFTEKQQQSKSISKMKLLQTPISTWKYIGMVDWSEHHSSTIDFLLAEIELVVVTGLDMYAFYARLASKLGDAGKNNTKIRGSLLLKIFGDSYEKMSRPDYNDEADFPQMYAGRNF